MKNLKLPSSFNPSEPGKPWDNTYLTVEPEFDIEGDLGITLYDDDASEVTWINRQQAQALVAHLQAALEGEKSSGFVLYEEN